MIKTNEGINWIKLLYRQCGQITNQELFKKLEKLHLDRNSTIIIRIIARQMAFEYLKKGKIDFSQFYGIIPVGDMVRNRIIDIVYAEVMYIKAEHKKSKNYEDKMYCHCDFNVNVNELLNDLKKDLEKNLNKIYNESGRINDFVLINKLKCLGLRGDNETVRQIIAKQLAYHYLKFRYINFKRFNDVLSLVNMQRFNFIDTIAEEFNKIEPEIVKQEIERKKNISKILNQDLIVPGAFDCERYRLILARESKIANKKRNTRNKGGQKTKGMRDKSVIQHTISL